MTTDERDHLGFALECLATDPGVPVVESGDGGTTAILLELDKQANSAIAHVLWPNLALTIEGCAYCRANSE